MTSPPPGQHRGSSTTVWIVSVGVVVAAVVVTLIVVLHSGGDAGSQAGAPVSPSPGATATSAGGPPGSAVPTSSAAPASTSVGIGVGGSGTALPTAATSATPAAGYVDGNCPPGEGAAYAVIDLTSATTVLSPGETDPGPSVIDTFTACATDTVRPRLTELYGQGFNAPDTDLTGGGGAGVVARYRMVSDAGGILTITLVKTPDDRYVCTDFVYQPA